MRELSPRLCAVCLPWVVGVLLAAGVITRAAASDYQSPRTMGLGGSGHAAPLPPDGIYLNPAYSAFLPSYTASAAYQRFSGEQTTNEVGGRLDHYGWGYNVSLQDGRSELFQAGFGFTRREDGNVINIGAAKSVAKRLGVGVGGKYYFYGHKPSAQDITAAIVGVPAGWVQVAAIVDNVLQTPNGLTRNLHREAILAAKFNVMSIVMLYFDPHWVPDLPKGMQYGFESGGELKILGDVFIRGGFFANAMVPFQGYRGRGFGAGLGWYGPRFAIDYGLTRVLESRQISVPRALAHNVGLTVYF